MSKFMADELLTEFLEETNESLTSLDQQFIELEKNPHNDEIVASIFRVMHTIKGTSGFLGFERLQKVAHAAENVMDKVRGKSIPVSSDMVSLILEAVDAVKEIVSGIEETSAEPSLDFSELAKRLNDFASSGGTVSVAKPSNNTRKTPDLDEEIDQNKDKDKDQELVQVLELATVLIL
jgi:two-component system chemotaxis sensor kinase CheA